MDKALLLDASVALTNFNLTNRSYGRRQAVLQFNALLSRAHELYLTRPDIAAMELYDDVDYVDAVEFKDAVQRLRTAIELRRPDTVTDLVDAIVLPSDASELLGADLQEFKEAIGLGLRKSSLLLAGALAEALLLKRHPDNSERGPGLSQLLKIASGQRLFGRDTLRQLETLQDYRDLIHTRSGPRNRIQLNDARVEHAVQAVKLLCVELEDINVRYE